MPTDKAQTAVGAPRGIPLTTENLSRAELTTKDFAHVHEDYGNLFYTVLFMYVFATHMIPVLFRGPSVVPRDNHISPKLI